MLLVIGLSFTTRANLLELTSPRGLVSSIVSKPLDSESCQCLICLVVRVDCHPWWFWVNLWLRGKTGGSDPSPCPSHNCLFRWVGSTNRVKDFRPSHCDSGTFPWTLEASRLSYCDPCGGLSPDANDWSWGTSLISFSLGCVSSANPSHRPPVALLWVDCHSNW